MAKAKSTAAGYALAVHVLLDESGSMRDWAMPTVTAYNGYINHLKGALQPPAMTLRMFCGRYRTMYQNLPIYDVPVMTGEEFNPNGGTPMIRAIVESISDLDSTEALLKVIVIITDGEDGSGMYESVRPKIVERLAKGWMVIFLGCNGAALATAGLMGIPKECAMEYSLKKLEETMAAAAAATLRFGASGNLKEAAFSDSEREKAK